MSTIGREHLTEVVLDGFYGIEFDQGGTKGYRFWVLECERTSPQNRSNRKHCSTAKKEELYAALIKDPTFKARWGIPNLDVQFVR